jgi:hypothetical protein
MRIGVSNSIRIQLGLWIRMRIGSGFKGLLIRIYAAKNGPQKK